MNIWSRLRYAFQPKCAGCAKPIRAWQDYTCSKQCDQMQADLQAW